MTSNAATAKLRRKLDTEIANMSDPYPDSQQFYEAVATVREVRGLAIAANRSDIAAVCRKVKTSALAFPRAQEILVECRALLACNAVPTDVLTPPQVAKLLSVSPDTVRAWIDSGKLVAENLAKPGKRPRYRISKKALAEFQKSRQVKQAAGPSRAPRRSPIPFKRY